MLSSLSSNDRRLLAATALVVLAAAALSWGALSGRAGGERVAAPQGKAPAEGRTYTELPTSVIPKGVYYLGRLGRGQVVFRENSTTPGVTLIYVGNEQAGQLDAGRPATGAITIRTEQRQPGMPLPEVPAGTPTLKTGAGGRAYRIANDVAQLVDTRHRQVVTVNVAPASGRTLPATLRALKRR